MITAAHNERFFCSKERKRKPCCANVSRTFDLQESIVTINFKVNEQYHDGKYISFSSLITFFVWSMTLYCRYMVSTKRNKSTVMMNKKSIHMCTLCTQNTIQYNQVVYKQTWENYTKRRKFSWSLKIEIIWTTWINYLHNGQ